MFGFVISVGQDLGNFQPIARCPLDVRMRLQYTECTMGRIGSGSIALSCIYLEIILDCAATLAATAVKLFLGVGWAAG